MPDRRTVNLLKEDWHHESYLNGLRTNKLFFSPPKASRTLPKVLSPTNKLLGLLTSDSVFEWVVDVFEAENLDEMEVKKTVKFPVRGLNIPCVDFVDESGTHPRNRYSNGSIYHPAYGLETAGTDLAPPELEVKTFTPNVSDNGLTETYVAAVFQEPEEPRYAIPDYGPVFGGLLDVSVWVGD